MSFVDAIYSKNSDKIHVVERVDGQRIFKEYPAKYVLYYEDPRGSYKSMWDKPCMKYETNSSTAFHKELNSLKKLNKNIHEATINPIFRCLSDNYTNSPTPDLNIGFFDIETDFDPAKGFASPSDPFSRITAISVYLTNNNTLITFVLKPDLPETDKDYLTWERAEEICNKFENTFLCNNEEELLTLFLNIIDDCDIISGWNSTGFDIPYTVNRVARVLGKDYTRKFCLWDQTPKKRNYVKFKKEQQTFDLVGRVHLDYLELFQKHNTQELHSYRLDYVGEIVVGENKIPYEGTLDSLYKRDFEKFIAYNRQDTLLLYKIDQKCRFIELANQLAHSNTVLLSTTMGAVAMIDQAIVNECWRLGYQVPDKDREDLSIQEDEYADDDDDEENLGDKAAGAYVADPKIGIHKFVGCIDINSLYPSTLRALNMGPETLVGQIRPDKTDALLAERIQSGMNPAEAWHGLFALLEYDIVMNKGPEELVVDFIDGQTLRTTGKDLYELIFHADSKYIISANGTIFRKDKEAVIPGLLKNWYAERKVMRAHNFTYNSLIGEGVELPEDLLKEIMN